MAGRVCVWRDNSVTVWLVDAVTGRDTCDRGDAVAVAVDSRVTLWLV